ncbi:hypothetical protein [Microbulbifer sp. A4B17]|uniref:hypothetical protein n=1 Tax=Microbulbifer sp. A4B17 TaxID=359370 RepID=UPI0013003B8D|nr:hypothetical protein [Microbulbifer sp. A4B17]
MKPLVICGLTYLIAWSVSLVSSLTIWNEFHLEFRRFAYPSFVFFSNLAVVGCIIFFSAAYIVQKLTSYRRGFRLHFNRTWILYGLGIWTMILSIVYWPPAGENVEGGNIGTLTAFFLAFLGIGIDLAASYILIPRKGSQSK